MPYARKGYNRNEGRIHTYEYFFIRKFRQKNFRSELLFTQWMDVPGCREQTGHLDASRWDVHPPLCDYMKTYEVISETRDGKLVAVVSTKAKDVVDAMRQTANFCEMMNIKVHSIRVIK